MRLAFEGLMILMMLGIGVVFVGLPLYKLGQKLLPSNPNPVKQAKKRLAAAKADLEAVRINHETDRLYDNLYREAIEDENSEESRKTNG